MTTAVQNTQPTTGAAGGGRVVDGVPMRPKKNGPSKTETRQYVGELLRQGLTRPVPGLGMVNPAYVALVCMAAGFAVWVPAWTGRALSPWTVATIGVVAGLGWVTVDVLVKHVHVWGAVYIGWVVASVTAWLTWCTTHNMYALDNLLGPRGWIAWAVGWTVITSPGYAMLRAVARKGGVRRAARSNILDTFGLEPAPVVAEVPESPYVIAFRACGVPDASYHGTADVAEGTAIRVHMRVVKTTFSQIVQIRERLETMLDVGFSGALSLETGGMVEGFTVRDIFLTIRHRDTLADHAGYPIEVGQPQSIKDPIRPLRWADGQLAAIVHRARMAVVSGLRGAGKSSFLNALVAEIAKCTDTIRFAIDPKQGPFIKPWVKPFAQGLVPNSVFAGVAGTPAEAIALLEFLCEVGAIRAKNFVDSSKLDPTPRTPHIVVFIDELPHLVGNHAPDKQAAAKIKELIITIGAMHRAAGIDLIMAAQRIVDNQAGGMNLMANVDLRYMMASADRREANITTGRGGAANDLSRLRHAGSMLLKGLKDERELPGRALFLDDEDGVSIPTLAQLRSVHCTATMEPEVLTGPKAVWWFQRWTKGTGARLLAELGARPVPAVDVVDEQPPADTRPVDDSTAAGFDGVDAETFLVTVRDLIAGTGADRMPGVVLVEALADAGGVWAGVHSMAVRRLAQSVHLESRQCGVDPAGRWSGNPRGYWLTDVTTALDAQRERAAS